MKSDMFGEIMAKPKPLPPQLVILNTVLRLVGIRTRVKYKVENKEIDTPEGFELRLTGDFFIIFTIQGQLDYFCNIKE